MTERFRNYFIEVNSHAPCFNDVLDIVKEQKCDYALITHDKDIDASTGALKDIHKHIVIVFDNARSFEAVRKLFQGAHIEIAKSVKHSMRYLLHLDHKEKHQYLLGEVETNNSALLNDSIALKSYPTITENDIVQDIISLRNANKLYGALIFIYAKYGAEQVKPYRQFIMDLIANNQVIEEAFMLAENDIETKIEKLPF